MNRQDYVGKILEAHTLLKDECVPTCVRKLDWLERLSGFNVIGKFENQQISGSFKYRGAYNFMRQQDKNVPVIAASAGNHALGVAEAGKRFGIKTTICIPTTASHVKRNRLAAYPHSLLLEGASLEESGKFAIDLAKKKGWDYISPYNNERIVHGQGTVAVEFLEQVKDIDTLVVPVGGGGLISGIALVAKYLKPQIKIIGVEPELYKAFSRMKRSGNLKKTANSPTFADGLAVNLEDNSLTVEIIRDYVDDVVTVSEEEMAAGVLAMLYHESQLIEGGGAAGVAAILAGKIDKDMGRIGVILTGGNISISNLSKIINYPFKDEKLLDYINVYGEKVLKKAALRGVDFSPAQWRGDSEAEQADEQAKDVAEDIQYFRERCEDVREKIARYGTQFADYTEYCATKGIKIDEAARKTFQSLYTLAENQLQEFCTIDLVKTDDTALYNERVTDYLQRYRALLHVIESLSLVLDWRSAAYNQSMDTMFFCLNSQDNPGVNYNRYESDRLVSLEKQLAEVLGLNQGQTSVLLTSSGMAAYTLMESYFIRHVLEKGDKVFIPQYLYFESEEQITQIKGLKIIKKDTHDVEEIVRIIDKENPKIVLLDPITNTVELRMTDIYTVIEKVAKKKRSKDLYFAVDGSLVSGELNSRRLFNTTNPKVHVVYYDSCSKYLQLGLDIAMGGLVAFPVELAPVFDRLRRNTGTILYDFAANIFPIYTREMQRRRMKRFSRNSLLIGRMIEADKELSKEFSVCYPLLKSHQDYAVAKKYESVGGLITFSFKEEALNQRESLNSLIEVILHIAKDNRISLTKGVSFGFSLPRISAAAAMAENAGPFLRLCVGDRSYDETRLLADTLIEAVKKYLEVKKAID